MNVVLCWCCDYFIAPFEDTTEIGVCKLNKKIICSRDKVCEEFIIHRGLHTEREIPEYCKNRKKNNF